MIVNKIPFINERNIIFNAIFLNRLNNVGVTFLVNINKLEIRRNKQFKE